MQHTFNMLMRAASAARVAGFPVAIAGMHVFRKRRPEGDAEGSIARWVFCFGSVLSCGAAGEQAQAIFQIKG